MEKKCACGSGMAFEKCCQPFINGVLLPKKPEALMRSRYTAYVLKNIDYIYNTTAPQERKYTSKKHIQEWANACTWVKLEVLYAKDDKVAFKAYYTDERLTAHVHNELSTFVEIQGMWYYLSGE